MRSVKILDCTLRDGGYCNQWHFGSANIKKIIHELINANIDIIECGFLTDRVDYNPDVSKFTDMEQFSDFIPSDCRHKIFCAMINYGEYNSDRIPECSTVYPDGLRIAFHKRNFREALDFCRKIQDKGYKIFIQAMVSLNYSDSEFLELIDRVNKLMPYSFYIVDSFGVMKEKDLVRLFYMIEHNLDNKIWVGFHSHNNIQLSFSNAQKLISIQGNRNLIFDSSVFGMGRGAGNLNTELFVEYLNENCNAHYLIQPLLAIIDEILNDFYVRSRWGYSLPNYVSAVHNAHPNYADYLAQKNTLTIKSMNEIFDMMDSEKKTSFDRNYIELLYQKYMAAGKAYDEHKDELQKILSGKKILLIAPGKSSLEERDRITEFASKHDVITISVNFDYAYCETKYIFISNMRRFKELDSEKHSKCIITSNISAEDVYLRIKYEDLTCTEAFVRDNSGLMLVKFLTECGVQEICLAGFDGYSHDAEENYADDKMTFITKNAVYDAMNSGMSKVLKKYSEAAAIKFLTEPRHVNL